jgi:hypothetical protein
MSGTTAQQLSDLADTLTASANAIDAQVNSNLDPLSPEGQHLKDMSGHIATQAATIGMLAMATLQNDVQAAVTDLNGNIKQANQKIAQIQSAQKLLSVAAALLSVAASAATRDPFGAAENVMNLVNMVQGAIKNT